MTQSKTAIIVAFVSMICICIAPCLALYPGSNQTEAYFDVAFPHSITAFTATDADNLCKSMGYSGYDGAGSYQANAWNSGGGVLEDSMHAYSTGWTAPAGSFQAVSRATCAGGSPGGAIKYFYTSGSSEDDLYKSTLYLQSITVSGSNTTAIFGITHSYLFGIFDEYLDTGDFSSLVFYPATNYVSSFTHTYSLSGNFTAVFDAKFSPSTTSTSSYAVTVNQPAASAILYFDVLDGSNPSAYVSTVNIGIRNTTSGVWRNSTASNGFIYFDSTGAAYEYPLAVGQTVTLSASANGFETVSRNVTIPYSGYKETFILPRTGTTPTTGGTTYNVKVVWNADGSPLNSAVVRLQTGVNGPCSAGDGCLQYTNENGITVFSNISSSATASITAFAQAAAQQVKIVNSNPNGTVNVNFSLVRTGQIPVTTPVQTPTGAVAPTATTASPYPVITDASGNVVTTSEGKGFAAFGLLIDYSYMIMQIAIYCILIWLLWMVVYILTGGKIIDKIMRRGRGRGR